MLVNTGFWGFGVLGSEALRIGAQVFFVAVVLGVGMVARSRKQRGRLSP